jgi:hypothetical protein
MRTYPRLAAWTVAVTLAVAAALAGAVASLTTGTVTGGRTHPVSAGAIDEEHNHNQVLL